MKRSSGGEYESQNNTVMSVKLHLNRMAFALGEAQQYFCVGYFSERLRMKWIMYIK